MVENLSPSVVLLTETWLTENIDNSVFCLPQFQIFRKDRPVVNGAPQRGGGTAILTNVEYDVSRVDIPDRFSEVEICAVDICFGRNVRFICVYRPPNCSENCSAVILLCIQHLIYNCTSFVICGDFNFSKINWINMQTSGNTSSFEFLNFVLLEGISQMVNEPTHQSGGILDLVLASDEYLVDTVSTDQPLASSDHFTLTFRILVDSGKKKTTKVVYDYSKCHNAVDFLLHINWNLVFNNCCNVNMYWAVLKDLLNFSVENFVPRKVISEKFKNSFPLSEDTKYLLIKKKKLWSSYRKTRNTTFKTAHKHYSKLCSQLVQRDRAVYENKLASDSNSKRFFKFVKSSLKRPSKIPPLIDELGTTVIENIEKCNLLNDFLVTAFTSDNHNIPLFNDRTDKTIDYIIFTHSNVTEALKSVTNSYSSGTDNIPAVFVNAISDVIVEPLCTLFNVCFYYSELPHEWLEANVVPIFKRKGSSSSPKKL